jgi:hypothetical protein
MFLPKRRVFIGVTMEKVLEEVYEDSDIQPLSKTMMLHTASSLTETNDLMFFF